MVDLNSILTIEKGQRVLLKICPTLRTTLEDCPGIDEELELQPKRHSVKRPGESFVSPIHKAAWTTTAQSVHVSKPNLALRRHSPTLSLSEESSQETYGHDQQIPPAPQPARKLPNAMHSAKSKMINNSTKPKRWPFDFTVYQIHNGFIQIRDTLKKSEIKSTGERHLSRRGGKGKPRPKYRIKVEEAFHMAFPGTSFRKATFYKHRELWAQYDREIVNMFIDLEDSQDATYDRLLKALKDPSRIPSPRLQDDSSSSSSESDSGGKLAPRLDSDEGLGRMSSQTDEFSPLQPTAPLSSSLEDLRTRVREYTEILEEILLDPTESQFFQSSRNTNYQAGSSQSQQLPSGSLADCIA